MCLPGPGISACTEADPTLWTEFLTHASENITLAQTSFAGGNNRNENLLEGNSAVMRISLSSVLDLGHSMRILTLGRMATSKVFKIHKYHENRV